MKFTNVLKKIIPHNIILFRRSLLPLTKKIMRTNEKKKLQIPILHIHLTDHCNLNCRGCDNFSPLSPEIFANFDTVEQDFSRISKLSNGHVNEIQLLGGEPLLHPRVTDFMDIARKYFPNVAIKIITNGVLILRQQNSFWEKCRQNSIEIVVTKYPIKIDHDAIEKMAAKQRVKFCFYGNTEYVPKNMQCIPLDLSGSQNARGSFLRCSRANRCVALDNGKIYTCTLIPYVKYFNSYFEKKLPVTEADSIDIYTAKDMDEILNFIAKPVPFCRFCNQKNIIWDIGYGVSEKKIEEWTG